MKPSCCYWVAPALLVVALLAHHSIGFGQVVSAPSEAASAPRRAASAQKQLVLTPEQKMPLRLPIKTARATSALAARQLLTPNLFDTGNAYFDGTSSAAYNIKTGEMWITAIRTPMQTPYWAGASYQTSAIQNTGAVPWKGVTVTATFQVVSVSGGGFARRYSGLQASYSMVIMHLPF